MISNNVALMTSIDSDQTAHKSNLTETLLFISAIFGIDSGVSDSRPPHTDQTFPCMKGLLLVLSN